jgi:serine/threonine-protein kinase
MSSAPSPLVGAPAYAVVGRYAVFDELASGGMAAVHLGRLLGAAGFSRTVAIKRLHAQFARDPEFSTMFMDEARLASRIQHPNVVQTLDVVPIEKEILLVMEYVHGVPFASLLGASRRAGKRLHPRVVAGVMAGVLEGLHAAHEVRNEVGAPLGVVHRDVSPQNVLLGLDGTPRLIDFGVAKAMGKMHATREGQLKGKLAYMSPEQVRGVEVTRLSDVFSASIVLWEALTFERLFNGSNPADLIFRVLEAPIVSPRTKFPDLPLALDVVVMKGLSRDPTQRYATAREMAVALEAAVGGLAPAREIGEWVASLAGETLAARAKLLESIEQAVAASPTSGENTRIDGLRALLLRAPSPALSKELALEQGSFLDSGPRPKEEPIPMPLGLPSTPPPRMGEELFGVDATLPQPTRSDAPPPEPSEPSGPPLPVAPRVARSVPPAAKSVPPAAKSVPPAARPAAPEPTIVPPSARENEPPLFDSPAARRPRPPRRIGPPQPMDGLDRASLKERLEKPLQLVAVGVGLSLVDWAVRELTVSLPVRPIWLAEILVVVGVVWAFARLALPSRD